MSRYIDLIEKTYNNKIFSKCINEEFGNVSIWIDTDIIDKEIIDNNIRLIDKYPKNMGLESPYSYMESNDLDDSRYKKFLRVLLLILSYSKEVIVDANINDNKEIVEGILNINILKEIKNNIDTFSLNDIDYNYEFINELANIALQDKLAVTFYLIDLKIILDIRGMHILVYSEGFDLRIVEQISIVEGLYLRKYK